MMCRNAMMKNVKDVFEGLSDGVAKTAWIKRGRTEERLIRLRIPWALIISCRSSSAFCLSSFSTL